MDRNKTAQATGKPKISQSVLAFAGDFIGMGKTLAERRNRLTAASNAWNIASNIPELRKKTPGPVPSGIPAIQSWHERSRFGGNTQGHRGFGCPKIGNVSRRPAADRQHQYFGSRRQGLRRNCGGKARVKEG